VPVLGRQICTDNSVNSLLGFASVANMCRRVTCKICDKPTWAGCGAHVESVLGDVPRADRCPGHTPAEVGAARASNKKKGGLLGWLRSYKTPA